MSQVLGLLDEINLSVRQVGLLVEGMIKKVTNGQLPNSQVLRKSTGKNIEGEPCIKRLIELRTVLEKITPIDNKIKYEVDKLIKTAGGGTKTDDRLVYKANIENLQNNEQCSSNEDNDENKINNETHNSKSGVYKPPKLSAQHYTDFETVQEKAKRQTEHIKKSLLSASILQDLREEYLDTPVEISEGNRDQQAFFKEQKKRQEYEEEYFTRLPVTKSEKYGQRQLTTLGTLGENITNFNSLEMKKGTRKRKANWGGKFVKSKGKRKRFH